MKSLVALGLLSLVAIINADCSLQESVTVSPSQLTGTWYEQRSYGDGWMQFFFKCIKNEIKIDSTSGEIMKTRSFVLKWFPWIPWKSQDTLTNRGTTWQLTSKFLFIKTAQDMSLLAADQNYLILKTCPNSWFTKERTWVYTNGDLTSDEVKGIKAVLEASNEPAWDTFKTISQSGC